MRLRPVGCRELAVDLVSEFEEAIALAAGGGGIAYGEIGAVRWVVFAVEFEALRHFLGWIYQGEAVAFPGFDLHFEGGVDLLLGALPGAGCSLVDAVEIVCGAIGAIAGEVVGEGVAVGGRSQMAEIIMRPSFLRTTFHWGHGVK